MLQIDKSPCKKFSVAIHYEWLETNGLGGWSSSSLIGCHTRRYHGLLVAATIPPADRMNILSTLDGTIIIRDQRFELGTNKYADTVHRMGYTL